MKWIPKPLLPGSIAFRDIDPDGHTFVASPKDGGTIIFLSNLSRGDPPPVSVWKELFAEFGPTLFPHAKEVWWERFDGTEFHVHKLKLR